MAKTSETAAGIVEEPAASVGGGEGAPGRPRIPIAFVGVLLTMGMSSLDSTLVNTALPRIVGELNGLAYLAWVVTAYHVALVATTSIFGKLGDMYGRRRMFMFVIPAFACASLMCAAAQTMPQLIFFRLAQGAAAGGLMSLSQAAIGDIFSPRDRAYYQGVTVSVLASCMIAGPVVGGVITTALSWRFVFLLNLPLALVASFILIRHLPRRAPRTAHNIDFLGAALLMPAAVSLMAILSIGGSATANGASLLAALVCLSISLFALFYWRERRAIEPIADFRLFSSRTFSLGVTAMSCMAFAMQSALVFLPLYLQLVLGYSPAEGGLLLLPQVVAMIITGTLGGRYVARTGNILGALAFGVSAECLGIAALSLCAYNDANLIAFELSLGLLGVGMGMGMANAVIMIQNSVRQEQIGVATSTTIFLRSLGGAAGVAVSGATMNAHLHALIARSPLAQDAAVALQGNVALLSSLSDPNRMALSAAYRYAIGSSFAVGAVVMGIAVLVISRLRPTQLRHD